MSVKTYNVGTTVYQDITFFGKTTTIKCGEYATEEYARKAVYYINRVDDGNLDLCLRMGNIGRIG